MTTPNNILSLDKLEEIINQSGVKICFIGERTLVERQIGPIWVSIQPAKDGKQDLAVYPLDAIGAFPKFCTWRLLLDGRSSRAEVLLTRQDDGANLGRKARLAGLADVTLTVQTVHGKHCKCPERKR